MKTLALEKCPVCQASQARIIRLPGDAQLQRCDDCGQVFAIEYADPDQVFVDGYMLGAGGQFGIDVRGEEFQRYLNGVGHRRLDAIERATGIRNGRLLDVGCGTGEVLIAARERGWTIQGVEPEASSAHFSQERGLPVLNTMLEDSEVPEQSFDVVSAFHVLEHIPESVPFLQSLMRWVRPGGFVTIEVPNFNSTQRRKVGSGWTHLRPLEHLVHFTPQGLQGAFVRAGLEPIFVRSPSYVGRPQNIDHALDDLGRQGAVRKVALPLTRRAAEPGSRVRYPTKGGWIFLRAIERVHDKALAGSVVFCVGRVPEN